MTISLLPREDVKISDEKASEILYRYALFIADRPEECMVKLAEEAGADWIQIEEWERSSSAVRALLATARKKRAWRMIALAYDTIKKTDISDGNSGKLKRNGQSLVKLNELLADLYRIMAAYLAPDTFGNVAHEIRTLQKEIASVKKSLTKQ